MSDRQNADVWRGFLGSEKFASMESSSAIRLFHSRYHFQDLKRYEIEAANVSPVEVCMLCKCSTLPRNLQDATAGAPNNLLNKARKPLVIEFAGVPKAGKTTTLSHVQTFLKRCGFHTDVVVERASVCPIRDKKHANFNIWTACTTLAQILEKTQNPPRPGDPQILFLDRGLFDAICWLTMMERLSRLRSDEKACVQQFLAIDDWRKRISAVFVMLVSPKDAMEREQGILPVSKKGGIHHESRDTQAD